MDWDSKGSVTPAEAHSMVALLHGCSTLEWLLGLYCYTEFVLFAEGLKNCCAAKIGYMVVNSAVSRTQLMCT